MCRGSHAAAGSWCRGGELEERVLEVGWPVVMADSAMPAWAAISPTAAALASVTVTRPGSGVIALMPAAVSRARSSAAWALRTSTVAHARASSSRSEQCARTRPAAMITTSSTVCATSDSRWLEIRTLLPSADVVAQERPQPADALRVESVGGLVEDEQAGPAEQRAGEAEALAHAEREAADAAVGRAREADAAAAPRRSAPRRCRRPRRRSAGAGGPCATGGRWPSRAPRRRFRADRRARRTGARRSSRSLRSGSARPSSMRRRRGLSRAVRAEEARHGAGLDLEGEVVHGHRRAVALGHMVQSDR